MLGVVYNTCHKCRIISIHNVTEKQRNKGEGSFACTTNWSSSQESIPRVRWNKFSTLPMVFVDPDAQLCFVSIKRPKDLWAKYWPSVLQAILEVPCVSREGWGVVCLQCLQICEVYTYMDKKKRNTGTVHNLMRMLIICFYFSRRCFGCL